MREYPDHIKTGAQRAQYNLNQLQSEHAKRLENAAPPMASRQLKRANLRKAAKAEARRNGGIAKAKRAGNL